MAVSKKQYEEVARMLHHEFKYAHTFQHNSTLASLGRIEDRLTAMFQQDNKNFDRSKFREAIHGG